MLHSKNVSDDKFDSKKDLLEYKSRLNMQYNSGNWKMCLTDKFCCTQRKTAEHKNRLSME